MLVAEPVRTPLADGSEDVPGLSLAGLARAFRVVVRHVGPSAGLVQLEQGDRVEEPPRRLPGVVPGPVAAEGADRKTVMIDATYLKAHRTASSLRLKKGGVAG